MSVEWRGWVASSKTNKQSQDLTGKVRANSPIEAQGEFLAPPAPFLHPHRNNIQTWGTLWKST